MIVFAIRTPDRRRVLRLEPPMSMSRRTAHGYRVPRRLRKPVLKGQPPAPTHVLWSRRIIAA